MSDLPTCVEELALKTTIEQLEDLQYWGPRRLDTRLFYDLHADAVKAHELTAQLAACQRDAEWLKLLLMFSGQLDCWEFRDSAGRRERTGIKFRGQNYLCEADAEGVPLRSAELESAILQAKGEAEITRQERFNRWVAQVGVEKAAEILKMKPEELAADYEAALLKAKGEASDG